MNYIRTAFIRSSGIFYYNLIKYGWYRNGYLANSTNSITIHDKKRAFHDKVMIF